MGPTSVNAGYSRHANSIGKNTYLCLVYIIIIHPVQISELGPMSAYMCTGANHCACYCEPAGCV